MFIQHACSAQGCPLYSRIVATITEVETLALDLPESQRAILAAQLLGSLPPVLHDEDEGVAEAIRRNADLEANRASGISLEQLDEQVRRRRP
jgi:putative addiction module component (TIGR02574 family)